MTPMAAFWRRPSTQKSRNPFFSAADLADVRAFYRGIPPTPLHRLSGLAGALGVADVLVKDETARFGLSSFKILGARYAMVRLIREQGAALTDVACATAGNHGLAVARVAAEQGLDAHVYVPLDTSPARIKALRAEGAHLVVTSVDYDETVRLMADDAATEGWTVISDTAWDGYETIPYWIMAGYTALMEEAALQWGATPPDLIVAQAGVGSFAGAVAGWLSAQPAGRRPALAVVEPEGSACVQASLRAGERKSLASCAPTAMTCLRCGEVSPIGWEALAHATDAAIAISDDWCARAISLLRAAPDGDPQLEAGPSGAAGVGALLALARDRSLDAGRRELGLTPKSRVLAIVTEGQG
jgi:diaminopropionate ammonia-lyase